MIIDILLLCVGLALILGGATWLVNGASSIARRFGIKELVIGLTVVAFGTSAPEFVISFLSALKGSSSLALGNVVGSNIFNMLVIVGITALIIPLDVEKSVLKRELPFAVLASAILFFCGADTLFDGSETDVVSRSDGLILLCFFVLFLAYTFAIAKETPVLSSPEKTEESQPVIKVNLWKASGLVVAGLGGLITGGELFVRGASGIAIGLGVSEAVVGLTIVAAGTSLPELATSVVAALKKNPGIAIGNVVGSCLFNIFFVLGMTATVTPISSPSIGVVDYSVMTGAAIMLFLFGWVIGDKKILRGEGAVLLLCYIGYVVYLLHGVN